MPLHLHQRPHVDRLKAALSKHVAVLDGSDVGTGKTYCTAAMIAELKVEALVICPLSVVPAWKKVLAEFSVTATVINYELAHRRLGKVVKWGKGSFFRFDKEWPLLVCDEAHRTAGDTSLNSKMLIDAVRRRFKILLLSATAADTAKRMKALGFALGLHSLNNFIPWQIQMGAEMVPVKRRNGQPMLTPSGQPVTKLEFSKEANATAMRFIHDHVFANGARGSRMRVAEIPNFPKTRIEVRLLDGCSRELSRLSEELQEFYQTRNTLAQFSEDEMAKLVYWRQAAEVAKIPHLLDMAEDALETSKVVVFVNFSRTIDELISAAHKRGWTTGQIRGDQSVEERQEVIVKFQANKTDLIVANVQAGGVGVSLHDNITQVARTSLICPPWRAIDLKQCFGRVNRDGGGPSRQFIVYWDDGIEARVARSVALKLNNVSLLNDAELDGTMNPETADMALLA